MYEKPRVNVKVERGSTFTYVYVCLLHFPAENSGSDAPTIGPEELLVSFVAQLVFPQWFEYPYVRYLNFQYQKRVGKGHVYPVER